MEVQIVTWRGYKGNVYLEKLNYFLVDKRFYYGAVCLSQKGIGV